MYKEAAKGAKRIIAIVRTEKYEEKEKFTEWPSVRTTSVRT